MIEQLIKKDCTTGEYKDLYPITTLEAIKDIRTGETLDEIIDNINQKCNHIYLQFKDNSKSLTRLQVPDELRRKGLWITYTSCKNNVITEWYNSDDFSDVAWKDSKNWVPYLDEELLKTTVKNILSWYKS